MVVVVGYFDYKEINTIRLPGIKISSENLDSITRPLPEGKYALCSLKSDNCILMQKGNLDG